MRTPFRSIERASLPRWVVALTALRSSQWAKNGFVFAALFFTPDALTPEGLGRVSLGAVSFSLVASATYIFNDLMDREADRLHPRKRHRALASGALPVPLGLVALVLAAASGVLIGVTLSTEFLIILGFYVAVSLAYSLRLKRVSIVDVFIISLGFVLRVQAGAVLIDIEPSAWIIIMTGLLTLFIALGKRRDDLVTGMDDAHRSSLRGYTKGFLDASVTAVLGALMVAYLIYTTDAGVAARLGDDRLYYTAPFVLMGILRYLQVTMVEERSGSPTRIALTDRFMVSTMLAWAGVFAWRIYA